eukprot:6188691-Pyramimonas_sp.AAC.1
MRRQVCFLRASAGAERSFAWVDLAETNLMNAALAAAGHLNFQRRWRARANRSRAASASAPDATAMSRSRAGPCR